MRRGSNQGNTQNEKSLYHQLSIDFRCYLGMALFEPRPRKLAGCHLTLIGPRSKPTDQALRAKFTRILTAIDKRPHGHSDHCW